ncbi:MAG: hypothetical protein JNL98_16905 [Bryobacterales bacterium]|nr:hypothetical protein [Bryobacterales bacterium]
MQLRLDPWQPEFGPEFGPLEDLPAESDESVDTAVEREAESWSAIDASPLPEPPGQLWLIDGVRRLEARVTVKLDGHYSQGAFGAYAVGAVLLTAQQAGFERLIRGRILALTSAEQLQNAVEVSAGLSYVPVRVAGAEPDAAVHAIHGEMRRAEEALAREISDQPGRLVIVDGPLTFEEHTRGAAVGYIKRVMKTYLTGAHLELLTRLQPGQRTPLFALRGSQRFSRIAWFLRLTAPRRGDSEFSGIVRLEVAEAVGVERARELAGACGAMLPPLKARRGLDQRAPQNLLPISALERHLRHRLGDERVIRRRIESFLMREAHASGE